MACRFLLTADAVRDLEELHGYIAEHDSQASVAHVLDRIEEVLEGLRTLPDRGNHLAELLALGMREYHEVFFKPYRIIYRAIGDTVYVHLIVDGRRDMRDLLERRLLRA